MHRGEPPDYGWTNERTKRQKASAKSFILIIVPDNPYSLQSPINYLILGPEGPNPRNISG